MTSLIRFLCAMIVVLIAGSSAQATLFTVDVTAADGTHSQQVISPTASGITTLPDGSWEWRETVNQPGSYFMQFDLLLNPDPSISGSIALSNSSSSTQTFTLNVSNSNSAALPAGFSISGSSAISVADANGEGNASLTAPPGGAVYSAFINNSPAVTQATLFGAPYTLAKVGVLGGVAVNAQSISAGLTTTVAATTIGIQHSFMLSGGDSATLNSTFRIVPEPCSFALAAIGAIALVAVYFGRGTK